MNRRHALVCRILLAVGFVLACGGRLEAQGERAGDTVLAVLRGHTDHVRWVAFSPDGKRLASASRDATVRIWDVGERREIATLTPHVGPHWFRAAAYSPDGRTLAVASSEGEIRLVATDTGRLLSTWPTPHRDVFALAFSPDGRLLASAGADSTIRLWDAETGDERLVLRNLEGVVLGLAFSPEGATLASGGDDYKVTLWELDAGRPRATSDRLTDWVYAVAYSPDGRTIASSGGDEGNIRLWDSTALAHRALLEGPASAAAAVAYSPDGRWLASAAGDDVVLWDALAGRLASTLSGHGHEVSAVAFSPDGRSLASTSFDRTVKLWSVPEGRETATLSGHPGPVAAVAFATDGRSVAAGGEGRAIVWSVETGSITFQLKAPDGFASELWSVAFSPDGRLVATAGVDGTARLWDLEMGRVSRTFVGHTHPVSSAAFSPDGRTLATSSYDGTVRLWDFEAGRSLAVLEGHRDVVRAVTFSPDGRLLASASYDETARLWGARSGRDVRTLEGHTGLVRSVAFSPDGNTLATGGFDDTVRLWSIDTGQLVKAMQSQAGNVFSVAFSPDSRLLAAATEEGVIRLWDTTGEELALLSGHGARVRSVAFSPSAFLLASASDDGTVRLWDLRPFVSLPETSVSAVKVFESTGYSPSVSRDGRLVAFADAAPDGSGDHVFVRDLESGRQWQLTYSDEGYEAGDVRISRDGRQVAFDWWTDDGRELHVVSVEGGPSRRLSEGRGLWRQPPLDWSADGRFLAVLEAFGDQTRLGVASVEDGSMRTLATYPLSRIHDVAWARFSPDSRHLAFNAPLTVRHDQRDVVVFDLATGESLPLLVDAADDLLLDWVDDGRLAIARFQGGRWAVRTMPAFHPDSAARPMGMTIERIESSLGLTDRREFLYVREGWINDLYLVSFDPATGKLGAPEKVAGGLQWEGNAAWSPDGGTLAYLIFRGELAAPNELVLQGPGGEHRVPIAGLDRFHAVWLDWSPDGRSLVVQGRHPGHVLGGDSQGLYRIDAATGVARPLRPSGAVCPIECVEWPAWSPDGRVFFVRWLPRRRRTVLALDPSTYTEQELYTDATDELSHLAVSPDGRWLAFLAVEPEARRVRLRLLSLDDHRVKTLDDLPWPRLSPYGQPLLALDWSPDSRSLIYAVTQEDGRENVELWRIAIDAGSAPERLGLLIEGVSPYGLAVHPDGERIAVAGGTLPRTEVWKILSFVESLLRPPLDRESDSPPDS